MDNILVLQDFLTTSGLRPDDFGRYRFNAAIDYASGSKGRRQDQTDVIVSMTSSENGKVGLGETSQLTADWCHLDLSPDWQRFDFDTASGALVISGKSSKMGGYEVRITPV